MSKFNVKSGNVTVPQMMQLEQRLMFDGAAVETTVEAFSDFTADSADTQDVSAGLVVLAVAYEPAQPALEQAQKQVKDYLETASAEELFEIFNGGKETIDAEWLQNFESIRQAILNDDVSISVELLSNEQMGGKLGAFAAEGPDGGAVIYLNQSYVDTFGADVAAKVLVEEIGHAIDNLVNDGADSTGDEGQLFADRVNGIDNDASTYSAATDDDHGDLIIGAENIAVEWASFEFVNAYRMITDLDGDNTVDVGENWAEKEQETHLIDVSGSVDGVGTYTTGLGAVSVNDDAESNYFSGNDVSAIGINIGGQDYYGWISRPLKIQGEVVAFYFWVDQDFVNLTTAQADGNQDADSANSPADPGVTDNMGFILVVNQSYFDGEIASNVSTTTVTGAGTSYSAVAAGDYDTITVGSSSDRVDNALNNLIDQLPVNTSPSAIADTDTSAVELGSDKDETPSRTITATVNAVGNVLSNDTDTDGDSLAVTEAASQSMGGTVTVTEAGVSITGLYGTLTIDSDGAYTYVINNDSALVDALLSGSLDDVFTYSISDGRGGSSNSSLTISIQGSNDAPIASDDYNQAKESTTVAGSTFDYTGYSATGNVLTNDDDVDAGDSLSISLLSISGSATATTLNTGSGATTLSFSALPSNVSVGYFVFDDGNDTDDDKTPGTLLLDANNNPITVASIDTTNKTFTLSGAVNNFTILDGQLLGFGNNTSGAAYKDAAISSSVTTGTSTVGVTGLTGSIAVGMTVTGGGLSAGVVVSALNYDGNGDLVSVEITSSDTLTDAPLTFLTSEPAGTTIQGMYGQLVLNSDGSYTYAPTVDNLGISEGDVMQEVFDYTMRDAAGETSQARLIIDVYGTGINDPTAVADVASATEAGLDLNYGSADPGYTLTPGSDPVGNLLTNDASPSAATEYVASVSINGSTASVGSSASGIVINGLYGTLTVDGDGSYSYALNNANPTVNALNSGDSLTETFTYVVGNDLGPGLSSSKLTITIDGSNDAVVASDDGITAYAGGVVVSGTVTSNDTDVDNNDTKTVIEVTAGSHDDVTQANLPSFDDVSGGSATLSGSYGALTINSDGTFTYTVDNTNADVINLADGATLPDTFTYRVADSAGKVSDAVLTVTVTGINDAPVNSYPSSVTTAPNTAFSFDGSNLISVADVDGNLSKVILHVDHGTLSTSVNGGSATIDNSGSDTITISGSQADINAALALLVYTPDSGFEGTDNLTLFSQDDLYAYDSDGLVLNVTSDTDGDGITDNVDIDDDNDGIIDINETGANIQWTDVPSVVGNTATGAIGGVGYTYTLTDLSSAALNIQTTPDMFSVSTFPSEYNVPDQVTIKNTVASINTITFAEPVLNPWLAFSSVGQSSVPVGIQFDRDVNVLWSTATSIDSSTHVTGSEGFIIIQLDGYVSSFTFTYESDETYVNFAFGADMRQDIDTDGDGVVDRLDIDSDNDGITDTVEAQATASYIPFDASLADADNDGLLNVFDANDSNTDPTISAGLTPVDTDSDGTQDYLDADSDNDGMADITERHDGQATSITDTTDTDGDGLLDIFEAADEYDGYDANDDNVDSSDNFTLAREASVLADGSNAAPLTSDLLFRTLGTLDVNDITVNEGSPYGVFEVTGVAYQQVSLVLSTSGATATGDGTDFGVAGETGLEYSIDGGNQWLAYAAGLVELNSSGSLLVRTPITNDSVYDNGETFKLVVKDTQSVPATVEGLAIIKDDGTGQWFDGSGGTGSDTAPTGEVLDDDRLLSVNSVSVNEGSPYAVFTVTGAAAGQQVQLELGNTADTGDTDATLGTDTGNAGTGVPLQYYNGAAWVDYTAGDYVTIPAGGTTLLVRTAITNDTPYEIAETFTLKATNTGGSTAEGVGTIHDDGTGQWFDGSGGTGSDTAPTGEVLDDDRLLSVNSVSVNEGSPYAVFTVTGAAAGQQVQLELGNTADTGDTDATLGTDTGNAGTGVPLQYYNGAAWVDYTAGDYVTIPAGGTTLLVRTAITNDTPYEIAETFTLKATNTGGSTAEGVGTIHDDGTGQWFDGSGGTGSDTAPTGEVLDDDRLLSVNSVTVNEGSPYAVFTVTGVAGQKAILSLTNGTTTGLSELQYWNGGAWVSYSSGNATLPADGQLLVRVALAPEQEAELDTGETFTLTAASTGGKIATGTGTIMDDGTGAYFAEDNNTAISEVPVGVILDDDSPVPAVPPATQVEAAPPGEEITEEEVIAPEQAAADEETLEAPENDLIIQRDIPIQEFTSDGFSSISYTIPADTFGFTNGDDGGQITLSVLMADGEALPDWLIFDEEKGEFRGIPPKGFDGVLIIRVLARDDNGKQVETMITIQVKPGLADQASIPGKPGLMDQLKSQSHFAWKAERDQLLEQASKLRA
ncbi:MAG: hypothetical protein GYB20_11510 [Oceanospirillales bacterium]|nr:hypothetical protein [Oceanospirillales bacterium]